MPWLTRFDRYLLAHVVRQVLLVWMLLLLVFSSLQLIGELRDMRAEYQLLAVFWHSLLTMAYRAYILFPFAALAGALLAVSRLVAQQELTVMRAAGSPRQRLMLPVLQAVALLLVVAVMAGELAGSWLEPKARDFRVQRITGLVSLSYTGGLWLRDGEAILHIGWPAVSGQAEADFSDINFYLQRAGKLCQWTHAEHGNHQASSWHLQRVTVHELCGRDVSISKHAELQIPSQLSTDLLLNMALRPSLLAIADLHAYVQFLQRSGLDSSRYRIAMFQRIYYPLTVLTLVWLALPLVLDGGRSQHRGRQMLLAMATGILLYIGYEMVESVTSVYKLNPAITILVPALLSLVTARWLYRREL
ncbi:MAG: LptF/LptG family permease [Gammaproteobacteria bacterium]|jgi:lipopolysaccharide export system permease protein|nr:LptF/LptG family permease [Gammaproteobacteria bacterium]